MSAKQGYYEVESIVSSTEKDASGKGKRVPIGSCKMLYAGAEVIRDALQNVEIQEMDAETGFPIYKSDIVNVIVDLVNARIDQRNKSYLVPGTLQLMAGKQFVQDLADLVATEGNKGEGAKRRAECITALLAYIREQGRSERVIQSVWLPMFSNPKSFVSAEQKYRDAALNYLSGFAGTLNEEQLVRYSTTLTNIETYASQAVEEDDDI